MTTPGDTGALQPIAWVGDLDTGSIRLLDQTRLPTARVTRDIKDLEALRSAIPGVQTCHAGCQE